MNFKKIDKIWEHSTFRPQLFHRSGQPRAQLGMECTDGFCIACKHALKDYGAIKCNPCYSDLPDADIEKYLLYKKPKLVLKYVRKHQTHYEKFFTNEILKIFPINDFPEYYI